MFFGALTEGRCRGDGVFENVGVVECVVGVFLAGELVACGELGGGAESVVDSERESGMGCCECWIGRWAGYK